MRGQAGDGPALQQHGTLAGIDEADDGFQRRALADAVAPEQPDHLARPDSQRHPVQDVAFAVMGVKLLDGDERRAT